MKKGPKKDKFSTSEVGALVEALRDEIKPLLEGIPEIKKKLDGVFEQVGKNTEEIRLNRHLIKKNAEKIERVLEALKAKVDQKHFAVLEKKVASLIR